MTAKNRNRFLVLLIIAFPVVILISCVISQAFNTPMVVPTVPVHNGYDSFVKAGTLVATNCSYADTMDFSQLSELVSNNVAALALVRSGLSKQCQVPPAFSVAALENHIETLSHNRMLAFAFIAEGRLAEMENR
jgi:hypothetical protein